MGDLCYAAVDDGFGYGIKVMIHFCFLLITILILSLIPILSHMRLNCGPEVSTKSETSHARKTDLPQVRLKMNSFTKETKIWKPHIPWSNMCFASSLTPILQPCITRVITERHFFLNP